jgi:hypothetical protein
LWIVGPTDQHLSLKGPAPAADQRQADQRQADQRQADQRQADQRQAAAGAGR